MSNYVQWLVRCTVCKVPKGAISTSSANPSAARSAIAFRELGGSGACERQNGITF